MRVDSLFLVFGEKFRTHGLADVVVQRHDADQQGIGLDTFGHLFGQVRHLDAVVESARSKLGNAL